MKLANLTNQGQPKLSSDQQASKANKAEIKGTGFQMKMVESLKGAEMIEAQRDSRRQRHIACLKECEKFTEQFYDNFSERKRDIKAAIKAFLERSDKDCVVLMEALADEYLLSNEIGYVNGVWEKLNGQRKLRNQEVQGLRDSLDNLKAYQ